MKFIEFISRFLKEPDRRDYQFSDLTVSPNDIDWFSHYEDSKNLKKDQENLKSDMRKAISDYKQ